MREWSRLRLICFASGHLCNRSLKCRFKFEVSPCFKFAILMCKDSFCQCSCSTVNFKLKVSEISNINLKKFNVIISVCSQPLVHWHQKLKFLNSSESQWKMQERWFNLKLLNKGGKYDKVKIFTRWLLRSSLDLTARRGAESPKFMVSWKYKVLLFLSSPFQTLTGRVQRVCGTSSQKGPV